MINHYERAYYGWSVLVKVASESDKITYKSIADRVGIHHRAVKFFLEVIQEYCIEMKLPALTILVVSQEGIQGQGFIACSRDTIDYEIERVYKFDWEKIENPFKFAESGMEFKILLDGLLENPNESERIYHVVQDRGVLQMIFRKALLKAYSNQCAICGNPYVEVLEACHINPWSRCSVAERIDPRNGILLCSNHHKMFDKGLLEISCEGYIKFDLREIKNNEYIFREEENNLNGKKISYPLDIKYYPRF